MTLNQFYEELRNMPRKYRRIARAYIKETHNKTSCPIAVLGTYKFKEKCYSYQYHSIGRQLKLKYNIVRKIVAAADNQNSKSVIRTKMLEALSE